MSDKTKKKIAMLSVKICVCYTVVSVAGLLLNHPVNPVPVVAGLLVGGMIAGAMDKAKQ